MVETGTCRDRHHTIGVDIETGVIDRVGNCVRAIGIGGKARNTDDRARARVLANFVCCSVVVRDGTDRRLVHICHIDDEALRAGRRIGRRCRDFNHDRRFRLMVETGACYNRHHTIRINIETGVIDRIRDGVRAIGIGGKSCDAHNSTGGSVFRNLVGCSVVVRDGTDRRFVHVRHVNDEGLRTRRRVRRRRRDLNRDRRFRLVIKTRTRRHAYVASRINRETRVVD